METLLVRFFVPILLGYILIQRIPALCYKHEEKEYNTLILHSLFYGLAILFSSYLIHELIIYTSIHNKFKENILYNDVFIHFIYNPISNFIKRFFKETFDELYVTSTFVFAFIYFFGGRACFYFKKYTSNLLDKKDEYNDYKVRLRRHHSTDLEKFLLDSLSSRTPLIFSLNNRKIYIGFLYSFDPNIPWDKTTLQILPIVSGFRNESDLTFSVSYDNSKNIGDGIVTPLFIKKSEIITVAEWNINP